MGMALQLIGDWGHALAAALFAALAIWIGRGRDATPERHLLVGGLLLTAFWALYTSFGGVAQPLSGIAESLRNGGWLMFMYVMLRRGQGRRSGHPVAITVIYAVLGGLLVAQTVADLASRQLTQGSDLFGAVLHIVLVLRMFVAVGALVLVHNLFTIAAPDGRSRIGLIMAALAAMWTYDLNLYAIAWATDGRVGDLYALRGLAMALLAPVIAVGAQRDGAWRLSVSRTVAFRSLSLVAVGLYLIALAAGMAMIQLIAGPHARLIEIGLLFAMAVVALLLLPSPRFRALAKVQVAKHFFQHRYDYRTEWIRFVDTIGRPGEEAAPFHERVVKAVADITDSSAGLLLLPDGSGALAVETHWNWPMAQVPLVALDMVATTALEKSGWIADLDGARGGPAPVRLPQWMLDEASAWALVPLIHFDRLAGAILLSRPRADRRIDWEDLDMLRAAGRQVASYISEAQSQQALDDAQRFDEFNRRFAFIMHDIKNLVSQLSLLSRNAQRHADNPEFRADMVLTLQDSVGKMNDMLARLSQHNKARPEAPRALALGPLVSQVVRAKGRGHPIRIESDAGQADTVWALADFARTEQILLHLIQNAIDASPDAAPITVRIAQRGQSVAIEVADRGCGMSAEFIRRDLFKPFSSSKPGGFGIGAFEARALAMGMDGRIEVESRQGEGSRFTLLLPAATPGLIGDTNIEERAA